MRNPWPARAIAIVALACVASVAHAAPARIVVLGGPGTERLTARVRAELGALGFDVVQAPVTDAGADDRPRVLDEEARRTGARATVLVVADATGVAAWIGERASGKTLIRRVDGAAQPASMDPEATATLALRTGELVRASLLELGVRAEPARPPLPIAEPETRPVRFALSPGVTIATGGVPPSFGAALALRLPLGRFAEATVVGALPITAAELSGPEGGATVRPFVGAATIVVTFGTRVTGSLGAGIGVIALDVAGEGEAGARGQRLWRATAWPHAAAGLALGLGGRWSLRADVLAGVTLPRVAITFVDRTAATWGGLAALALVGIEFAFSP